MVDNTTSLLTTVSEAATAVTQASTVVNTAVSTHVGQSDPHTQYVQEITGQQPVFVPVNAQGRPTGPMVTSGGQPIQEQVSFVDLPPAWEHAWEERFCPDIGVGGSVFYSDGLRWLPRSNVIVLAAQGFAATVSDATTDWRTLFNYTIPPGLVSDNSSLVLSLKASWPGSTPTKRIRARLGTTQIAFTDSGGNASVLGTKWEGIMLASRGQNGLQLGEPAGVAGAIGQQTQANQNATADMLTRYLNFNVQGSWAAAAAGANSITLDYARLELRFGA